MRYAELNPEIPASMFPLSHSPIHRKTQSHPSKAQKHYETISSRNTDIRDYSLTNVPPSDEFIGDEIDDEDLLEVGIFT